MEIEQGYYVKQHIDNINYDDYFLVLDIENKHIKVAKHRGTPVDSVILDYEDLTDAGYTIEVLSEKYVDCITKYGTYLKKWNTFLLSCGYTISVEQQRIYYPIKTKILERLKMG